MPVIVYYNGERVADDRVRLRQVSSHDLVVTNDANGHEFGRLLDGTPLRVMLSNDFLTRAWRKLLLNVVVNPITALTLQRQVVVRREDVHALCLDMLEEAAAVGRADGAQLADDEPARIMAALLSAPPGLGTSMYFDRLAGRSLRSRRYRVPSSRLRRDIGCGRRSTGPSLHFWRGYDTAAR